MVGLHPMTPLFLMIMYWVYGWASLAGMMARMGFFPTVVEMGLFCYAG